MRLMEKGYAAVAGQKFPGVIVSEPVATTASTATGRSIPTFRADVITLRTTNPANGPVRSYLRKTNEDLGFWFPRTRPVVGLDATEHGEVIDLEALSDKVLESTLAFQAARIAAQAEDVEVALD
jgi:hypothetical protein